MTTFRDMMETLPCALVCLGMMVGMAVLLYAMASAVAQRMPARHAVLSGATFALAFATTMLATGGMELAGYLHRPVSGLYALFCGLPFALYVALLACVAAVCAAELAAIRRWRAGHITPSSVKEALDHLPQGLRFVDARGRTVLENLTMARIGREPAGDVAWRRSVCAIDVRGEKFTQETMTDVTAWRVLNARLQEQVSELRAMQDALVQVQRDVRDVVREQEVLEAKVAVHDELGHLLLMAERHLAEPDGDVDAGRLLALWEDTLDALARGMEGRAGGDESALDRALADARDMGVDVRFEGAVPEDGMRVGLLCRAVRECAANAAKHAGATELRVRARALGGGVVELAFTNDGALPQGEVRETGGLRSLRLSVEDAGGEMRVETTPAFRLTLRICVRGCAARQ